MPLRALCSILRAEPPGPWRTLGLPKAYLWLAGNEGMDMRMEITIMGDIGTTRIHPLILANHKEVAFPGIGAGCGEGSVGGATMLTAATVGCCQLSAMFLTATV